MSLGGDAVVSWLARRITALVILLTSSLCWAAPPNVLLIYVDDLGYGDLGHAGHPVLKTPRLDKLAQQGVRLTNYYAPSALCSPSRAGLLTGRHPYRTGIESWIPGGSQTWLRNEEVTLAEVLRASGYSTALVGKWHLNADLGDPKQPQPNDQGFDYAYGHNAFQLPTNKNPTNLYRNGKKLKPQKGYTAQLYADDAIRWMSQHAASQPFFLMLSMAEPHTSIENPPAYNRRYRQFTNGNIIAIPSGLKHPPKELLVPRGPGEYYANVTFMDAQIGRVLDALRKQNKDKDTLVVFASDNGPVTSNWINWWEVNAYGSTGGLRGRKHMLYEGGIKVPAIIRYPQRLPAGTTTAEPITGMDLFNTIIDLTGSTLPSDRAIDGISALPALEGETLPERTLLWALDTGFKATFALRQGDWKLLLNKSQTGIELYNLREDPLELFNVLSREPEIAARLESAFAKRYQHIMADPLRPGSEAGQPDGSQES